MKLPHKITAKDFIKGGKSPVRKFGELAIAERPKRVLHVVDPTTATGASAWFENQLRRARAEGVFVIEEVLTKPLANLLLDNNDANRMVLKSAVREMAQAMRANDFDGMNGETIKISLCGQLNDGQHRCHARIEADVDIRTRFMFGLPREGRLTIDQGRQRRANDYLLMDGMAANAAFAAVAKMLHCWRNERRIRSKTIEIGRSQVAAYAKANYDQIQASYNAVYARGCSNFGGTAFIVFCHLIFSELDASAANDFIHRLVRGEGLDEDSPILIARQRMISTRRMSIQERLELIIRAWNSYREGKRQAYFQIRGVFPDISK